MAKRKSGAEVEQLRFTNVSGAGVETLAQARKRVQGNLREGIRCPCCEQYIKLYKRTLNASMAVALLLLYREYRMTGTAEWVHFQSYIADLPIHPKLASSLHGGTAAKLRFWGFIELKPEAKAGSRSTNVRGFFRITEKGIAFAKGEIRVPKHMLVLSNKRVGSEGPSINIKLALQERFDYDELMRC